MAETLPPISTALLIFSVGGQRYGLPVARIRRIIEMVAMLELPGAPDGVQGVINVQGRMVPVIDLRRRWGLPPQPYTIRTPIILAEGETEGQGLGLVVDQVDEVIELSPEQLQRIERIVPGESGVQVAQQTPYLVGVARWERQLGLLVQMESLLSPAEQTELETALHNSKD